MLEELLAHLHNWFVDEKYFDEFTIADGVFASPILSSGQYFRIIGSLFNDGVYMYPASGLTDEVFTGAIWSMKIPQEVISISTEIDAWQTAHPASEYTSESFGGYTYAKATTPTGLPASWQQVFHQRLNRWRKI